MVNKCLILFGPKRSVKKVHEYSLVSVFYPETNEYEFIKNRYDYRNYGIFASNLFEQLIREYGIISIEMSE